MASDASCLLLYHPTDQSQTCLLFGSAQPRLFPTVMEAEPAPRARLQRADRNTKTREANKGGVPEKSPKGGKGSKSGKGTRAAASTSASSKDSGKPKVTKARSAYNFYLLNRIAQVRSCHGTSELRS